jgi:hypothetical protein
MCVLNEFGVGRAALVLLCSLFPVTATSYIARFSSNFGSAELQQLVCRLRRQSSSHVIPICVVFEISDNKVPALFQCWQYCMVVLTVANILTL